MFARTCHLSLAVAAIGLPACVDEVEAPPGRWVRVTDPGAGALAPAAFRVYGNDLIHAVVDGAIASWSQDRWIPVFEPPPDHAVDQFQLIGIRVHALLRGPGGSQVFEYVGEWQPRTAIGHDYAGTFSVDGPDAAIHAVIASGDGDGTYAIARCGADGCTARTRAAAISAVDFECVGCDGRQPTFYVRLDDRIHRGGADTQWSAITPELPGLGPAIETAGDGTLAIEIADRICEHAGDTYACVTPALPGLTELAIGPSGTYHARAGDAIWRFDAPRP